MRVAVLTAPILAVALAAEARAADYYVTATSLNVRLCADQSCPVAQRLAHGAKVTVHERRGSWARISGFFDPPAGVDIPKPEADAKAARWVAVEYLSEKKPPAADPAVTGAVGRDPRITLPSPGQGGLTTEDVRLLRKYATQLLKDGECTAITTGDKSAQRPGAYFVICANEYKSRVFTRRDVR